MMQSMLFLRSTDDGPIDRIINIDLLSTAAPHADNPEWTRLQSGLSDITLHMPFAQFLKQVEHLIAENYRVGTETSARWHKKRMEDSEEMMKSVMKDYAGHA
jgi:hypothetical protein